MYKQVKQDENTTAFSLLFQTAHVLDNIAEMAVKNGDTDSLFQVAEQMRDLSDDLINAHVILNGGIDFGEEEDENQVEEGGSPFGFRAGD